MLTHIFAPNFGQNYSLLGRSGAPGGHCEPMTADSNTTGANMEGYR
jgi:hypothetical protein